MGVLICAQVLRATSFPPLISYIYIYVRTYVCVYSETIIYPPPSQPAQPLHAHGPRHSSLTRPLLPRDLLSLPVFSLVFLFFL
jgi:hypothetical protein